MQQPPSARTRAAAFFDVDGTLVAGQALWRGVVAYHRAQRRRRLRLLRFFAVNLTRYAFYKAGRMERATFVAGWGERLAGLFSGLSPAEGAEVFAWVWQNTLRPALRPDVVARLVEHQRRGDLVVLVSATLDGLMEAVRQGLGADVGAGSIMEVRNGRYTGRIVPPLCFGPQKATRARALAVEAGITDLRASFAYADTAADAPFLSLAGYPVAVYPDPRLAALAAERGWEVLGGPQV